MCDNSNMRNNNNNNEREEMSLEEYQKRLREGKEPIEKEGSHQPTADQVTMGGRFGNE